MQPCGRRRRTKEGFVVSQEGWNKVWVSTHLEKLVGRTLELDSRHSSCRKGATNGKRVVEGGELENADHLSWTQKGVVVVV